MTDFNQAESYEDTYSLTSSYTYEDGMKMIKLLVPQKGDKVLDIGCGTGYLTKALADLVGSEGKVIGVDPDVQRLEIAKKKYAASNVEFLVGTAEDIPGNDSDYDIIFSSYALHWCKDKRAVLNTFSQRLKQGGKLGIVGITNKLRDIGPPEMYSQNFLDLSAKFYSFDDYFEKEITSRKDFKIEKLSKHVQAPKMKSGVSDLVKYHMTHFHGQLNATDFDVEAMKRHYGEGEFSLPIELINVIAIKHT